MRVAIARRLRRPPARRVKPAPTTSHRSRPVNGSWLAVAVGAASVAVDREDSVAPRTPPRLVPALRAGEDSVAPRTPPSEVGAGAASAAARTPSWVVAGAVSA